MRWNIIKSFAKNGAMNTQKNSTTITIEGPRQKGSQKANSDDEADCPRASPNTLESAFFWHQMTCCVLILFHSFMYEKSGAWTERKSYKFCVINIIIHNTGYGIRIMNRINIFSSPSGSCKICFINGRKQTANLSLKLFFCFPFNSWHKKANKCDILSSNKRCFNEAFVRLKVCRREIVSANSSKPFFERPHFALT